jgi:pimeloyl-ACP methyl ester carboxylesterase
MSLAVQAQAPRPAAYPRKGVVLVLGGSGNDYSVSENLGPLLSARGVPLKTVDMHWCRKEGPFQDHRDHDGQMLAARRVADYVAAYRRYYTYDKIYLIGHSSGTHVVLVAAGSLPPGYVDRLVLLAPSVSCNYDLRPALRACAGGILSTYSPGDTILGFGSTAFATADRKWTTTAGEDGFIPPPANHPDRYLYRNLRQIAYDPAMIKQGHLGGHFGVTRSAYLSTYVVPFLTSDLYGR